MSAVLVLAAHVSTGNAFASNFLYEASSFNAFMLDSFTDSYSDVQGGLAAGGKINIVGFSVGQGLPNASGFPQGYTLVAGGLLTASSGALYVGNASGSTTNVNANFTINNGTLTTGGPQVIDFADATTQLRALSNSLAGRATTAGDSCTLLYSTTTCTAAGNGLNIINVANPSIFAGNNVIINSTGTNVTLVINIAGSSDVLGGAGFSAFNNGSTVLLNYPQATSLALGGSAFTASLLAPFANVSANSGGNFNGTLVANNFSGQLEFHNQDIFAGDLGDSVPEPASMVLGGGGLILIGLFLRKRNGRRTNNQ